jgi:hypothetical protein
MTVNRVILASGTVLRAEVASIISLRPVGGHQPAPHGVPAKCQEGHASSHWGAAAEATILFFIVASRLELVISAFTNSPVLHVLEAAHIRPYSLGGTHAPSNGILLRQDLHTLFDRGYMTVAPKNKIEISSRIKEEFHNGKEYYKLHGETMRLPRIEDRQPSGEFLRWHNENIYRG